MNWAVVMAGGRGTRFWPESRNANPKPFLRLLGRRTLLEETVRRLSPFFPPERILVVLQQELRAKARRILKELPPQNILGEPMGKNTAPCCVWAASRIERREPGAKVIFLPADQFITPRSLYQKTLRAAFQIVDERPVLVGMKPDSPQTGFGYLEVSRERRKVNGISYFTVLRFHEKPSLKKAKRFLRRGNFLWNGGTFVWRLEAFKEAVQKYAPGIYAAWDPLGQRAAGARGRASLGRIYRGLPSISLDYAVMEKMNYVHCLLAPFRWKDVGGWEGLAQFWPRDGQENRVAFVKTAQRATPTIFVKSRHNIVKTDKRLIALLGIENFLIVDTGDALLISPRSRTEEIREVVRELEKRRKNQYL